MNSSIKIGAIFLVISTLIGCASAQKSAQLDIKPMPAKISHSDETAVGFYQQGQYFESTQRPEEALRAYQEASNLDPGNVKPQLAIAVLNAKNGNFSASITQLKHLVEKYPKDASLYNNLGYAYYLTGDYKNAASALGEAVVLDPKHILALNNMGATLNKLGKTELALKYTAQAQAIKNEQIQLARGETKPQANLQAEANFNDSGTLVSSQSQSEEVSLNASNSQTEIRQVTAGVYELVKAKLPVETVGTKLAVDHPVSEIQVLVQSGGITFKIHPLVNKLFKENVAIITSNSDIKNKAFNLEIVNGNGIKGFAKKTADTLAELGISQPVQLANKKHYNQHLTVLEYKSGYYNEAIQLAQTLDRMPVLVKTNNASQDAHIRLVLGKDVINTHYKYQQYS